MPVLSLPPDVESVIRDFFTAEFTTVNKKGQPITWPTLAYYDRPRGRIIVTASVAFLVKTYNARRHPQVSLLYSDPVGTRLGSPPAVLVQGDATVEEVLEDNEWSIPMFKTSVSRQPESKKYVSNPITQRLFTFYFQRIAIFIRPRRIMAWDSLDFANPPRDVEVRYVE
jgi:hypothetical protein